MPNSQDQLWLKLLFSWPFNRNYTQSKLVCDNNAPQYIDDQMGRFLKILKSWQFWYNLRIRLDAEMEKQVTGHQKFIIQAPRKIY